MIRSLDPQLGLEDPGAIAEFFRLDLGVDQEECHNPGIGGAADDPAYHHLGLLGVGGERRYGSDD